MREIAWERLCERQNLCGRECVLEHCVWERDSVVERESVWERVCVWMRELECG